MNDRAHDGKTGSGFHPSRRDFLTQAGLLAGGMALLGIPALRPQQAAAALPPPSVGSSALELDGQFVDFLKSVEGGFTKSEVIHEPVIGDTGRQSDIRLSLGVGLGFNTGGKYTLR